MSRSSDWVLTGRKSKGDSKDGLPNVLVNGTFVVRDGQSVAGVYPGRAVLGKYRR